MAHGVVVEFDDPAGYGIVRSADGEDFFFHCTALLDGTRRIEAGVDVTFEVVPGRRGQWEASKIRRS
jgi:cold shock CspA family protein